MKKTAQLTAIALASALSFVAPSALAASSSNASLSGLTLWVFDLNPLDAVTPTFSIVSGLAGEYTSTYANIDGGAGSSMYGGLNLSSFITDGTNTGQATLVGGVNLSDFVLTSAANAGSNTFVNQTDAYGSSSLQLQVQFSSDALLVITGNGSASALSSTTAQNEYASGTASVQISQWGDGTNVYNYGQVNAYSGFQSNIANPSIISLISASVANTTGSLMTVYVQAGTYSYANVTAVPEPESYALMVGGLGLLAWTSKRRKRQG